MASLEAILPVRHLGIMPYARALDEQHAAHARVLASRDAPGTGLGEILLVEHEAVITLSARASRGDHLLASENTLRAAGIELARTDRGGDITYHGPGQIVCYPIIDLERAHLRVHDYLRLLEQGIIDAIAEFGVVGVRDPSATGVWVPDGSGNPSAKIAAIGIRVRRWITMHGLALNVRTNLAHFGLIVPCGLSRPVTSLERELGSACPTMAQASDALVRALRARLTGPVQPSARTRR